MTGTDTNKGLFGWLLTMLGLVVVFHLIGFRVIFTAGRSV